MNSKINFFVLCIILMTSFVSCIFPYPLFTKSALVGDNVQTKINNYFENETENSFCNNFAVLNLDWFSAVDIFFEIGSIAKIIDIHTLKSFYVKRVGGSNHADIEPIDSENTQIFKTIIKKWSWEKRPIWIQIKNSYFCASISGIPHGFSKITDNDLDGHLCVHFLNSKTHGTKKVDPEHQKCIELASNTSEKLFKFLRNQS